MKIKLPSYDFLKPNYYEASVFIFFYDHLYFYFSGLTEKETTAMSLGLAHSLSRYKLKFSPDKVDTMIVQAISLLDDLDKELNNYVMRCREWYGWHFPEMGKIVTDNLAYAKTVKLIGNYFYLFIILFRVDSFTD